MTPAEKLSATFSPNGSPRRPRPQSPLPPPVWVCSIRERRKSLRLTLREVAEAVGLSFGAVRNIESGCDLRLTTARRLMDFFGASSEALWPELARKKT